jgi:hypothetical protein
MAEAVDLPPIRASLRGIALWIGQERSATARDDKARRMPLKPQVLHVVVVTGQIHVDLVLLKEGIRIPNQNRVVPMHAIGIDR